MRPAGWSQPDVHPRHPHRRPRPLTARARVGRAHVTERAFAATFSAANALTWDCTLAGSRVASPGGGGHRCCGENVPLRECLMTVPRLVPRLLTAGAGIALG